MSDGTQIEWTDATWNPITGCSVVSVGCKHCYAMKLAGTRLQHHPSRQGLTIDTKAGAVWNGNVRFNVEWIAQPLRWRRPRMIFVCAHGDLFHEAVPDDWVDKVFAVMALAPQHSFQILTKRPERMRRYFDRPLLAEAWWDAADRMACDLDLPEGPGEPYLNAGKGKTPIPLPNVWLGVSAENQETADERIPFLLRTPAVVRWISAEPLLGPIDLESIFDLSMDECYDVDSGRGRFNCLSGWAWNESPNGDGIFSDNCIPPHDRGRSPDRKGHRYLDWVVVGGESGAEDRARPMHPDWARSLRDQCAANGVPFLFKQ